MTTLRFLSNGAYRLLATASGHGCSSWANMAVTRWSADGTLDDGGSRCHLRDDAGNAADASATGDADGASAATGHRLPGIDIRTEFAVAPDDPVELRRVTITNLCGRRRTLSATSYAEIVLSPAATDSAHPAFSKLFIETAFDGALQAILATRRPGSPGAPTPWLFHLARIGGSPAPGQSFETDRMRFVGRGRPVDDPQALDDAAALPGTTGPVLDAVAAIRVPFVLEPGASITIDWLTGVAPTREACIALANKAGRADAVAPMLAQAGSYRRTVQRTLGASDAEALLYDRMAASLVYPTPVLRTDADTVARNRRGQSGLWGFGISGDLPIVLLELDSADSPAVASQMVQAQAWWNAFGLRSELAVVCAPAEGGGPSTLDLVRQQLAAGPGAESVGRPGGIFLLDDGHLDDGDRTLLRSVARIVLTGADPLGAPIATRLDTARLASGGVEVTTRAEAAASRARPTDPVGVNAVGGFSPDGREYVIDTSAAHMTPAPWVNLIANPEFGTLVSESGSASTWSENAHEFRLTPWSNDPVSDPNTEALYIRDDASGRFWSPTLLPTRGDGAYTTRHGFGYSVFTHAEDGIDAELRVYVAIDSPVKFSHLTLRNRSDRPRRLSVTGCVDWVLGDERSKTQMQVVTEIDATTGALFARNAYNTDFAGRTAFFDAAVSADDAVADVAADVADDVAPAADPPLEFCGDRADFYGLSGTLAAPAAMTAVAHTPLSGRVGATLDPCAALRVAIDLAPGQSRVVVFRLGAGKTPEEARDLVRRWRKPGAAGEALDAVHAFWRRTLGAVQVHTPEPTLDVLANGWLLYQVIASRLWGRTAFYQSSGAFGFRDQLQDVMALVHAAPALVREHLLRAAARQFVEGDVQHWWHPPSGKGIRTRCADDLLWLPLATCRYVEVTGDRGVLDVPCPFLDSRPLKDGALNESALNESVLNKREVSNYELPKVATDVASLYEHGVRAIRHASVFGERGLPLMGGGDWNDGMNLVGAEGRGESVWMAFFLITVLKRFAPLAQARGDIDFAGHCAREAARLRDAVEASAWDGAWYRRAWFDDGTVLGSAANTECRIDSIAQSWAVLSGAAPPERAQRAMASLDERLVRRDTRLIQLLEPPFDTSDPSPGYIQGYVPGVRENGGQYTHAAVWAAMAFASLGDTDRAWELFSMLNPLQHAATAAGVATYQVEPYVMAGDVYAYPPHAGRGGWTWYTGSAGWMAQFVVESLLGVHRSGNRVSLRPLLPAGWTTFEVGYRFGESNFAITCRLAAAGSAATVVVDGVETAGDTLTLIDDGHPHEALVNLAPRL